MAFTVPGVVSDGNVITAAHDNSIRTALIELQDGLSTDSDTAPTWVPTWTNLTVGNGTVTARYGRFGPFAAFYVQLIWGTTTSISGSVVHSLPTSSFNPSNQDLLATVKLLDASASATYAGTLAMASATTCNVRRLFDSGIAGNPTQEAAITATTPFTWTTGDTINTFGLYLAA